MGAGKSTLGPPLAERLGRPFVSVDAVVEERAGASIGELFETRGEAAFRELEEEAARTSSRGVRSRSSSSAVALWPRERTRALLAEHALTVHLEIEPDEAWERVSGTDRPLARDPRGVPSALRRAPAALRSSRCECTRPRRRGARRRRDPLRAARRRARRRTRRGRTRRRAPRCPAQHVVVGCEDRSRGGAALASAPRSTAGRRSSRSVAARRPTSSASSPRRTCAGSTGSRCRRRSSGRSTPRSAARWGSTFRRGRTSWARSTGPRPRSSTRRCSTRFRARSCGTASPRS